jgi:hypothetical protein
MEPATENEIKNAHKRTVIIWASMALSVVVYVVVAERVRSILTPDDYFLIYDGSPLVYLRYALLVVSLGHFLLIKVIPAGMLARADSRNVIAKLIAASVISFALCEAMAIYGLLLFLAGGNIVDTYVGAVLSAVGLGMVFPKCSQWEELVEQKRWRQIAG